MYICTISPINLLQHQHYYIDGHLLASPEPVCGRESVAAELAEQAEGDTLGGAVLQLGPRPGLAHTEVLVTGVQQLILQNISINY